MWYVTLCKVHMCIKKYILLAKYVSKYIQFVQTNIKYWRKMGDDYSFHCYI